MEDLNQEGWWKEPNIKDVYSWARRELGEFGEKIIERHKREGGDFYDILHEEEARKFLLSKKDPYKSGLELEAVA